MTEHECYIRVIEQFPQLLQLEPQKADDFKLVVAMAYTLGKSDGHAEALNVFNAVMTRAELKS